jgi:hypothetical protein
LDGECSNTPKPMGKAGNPTICWRNTSSNYQPGKIGSIFLGTINLENID